MADTITIDRKLFVDMRIALMVADEVLQRVRFTGMDQNPKGVRDLVGSAAHAASQIDLKRG